MFTTITIFGIVICLAGVAYLVRGEPRQGVETLILGALIAAVAEILNHRYGGV